MGVYKVVIIDDEQLAIDVISNYINRYSEFELAGSFTNPVEAFTFINDNDIDLAFTDIAMPEIKGTDLVKLAKERCKFVMVTSYSNFAIESFELDVVDYLLKPVSFERFDKTVSRFLKYKSETENTTKTDKASFFIKEGDEYVKVYVDDIDYIEGMRDYAKIYCGKNYYLALKTLKSIGELLTPHNFLRVHKSYIVPLDKIKQYNVQCVILSNNSEIPVGPGYRDRLKDFLNQNKF
ncbi:MAG: LytTR family DNA-binding domain-containing protein [Bacteroidales bacterium]|jgi:DNA-binding LytR/AlgR family response regulator|nr:LytTR family DNA-binding domain-containing protein [Bacteroidales bacterium]